MTKLPAAIEALKKRPGLSVSQEKAKNPSSSHVLMEKTTKRYGEKGEHLDFSPFLGGDQQDPAYGNKAHGFFTLGSNKKLSPAPSTRFSIGC
jgi:hypothetical protein